MAVSLRVPDDVKKRVARLADAQDFQAFFEVCVTRLPLCVAELLVTAGRRHKVKSLIKYNVKLSPGLNFGDLYGIGAHPIHH